MRKPLGVIAATVVLGLMTAFGLFFVLLTLFVTLFVHMPFSPLPPGTKAFLAIVCLIFLCIFAFCAWTVVDLYRMRSWARYSIVVLGILTTITFGAMCFLILFALARMAARNPLAGSHLGVILVAVTPEVCLALIGMWWAVYFNLKHVREAFANARVPVNGLLVDGPVASIASMSSEYEPWHSVVIGFAILMLLGGASELAMVPLRLPLFLYGTVLQGNAALIMALLVGGVTLFAGIGLLRRVPAAYWTALVLEALGIVSIPLALRPSMQAQAVSFQAAMRQRFPLAFPTTPTPAQPYVFPQHFQVVVRILELAVALVFIYALLRCRRWFAPTPEH
jgi:hypothetical protein